MQQVEVEMVGAEASEACLASTGDAVSRHLTGLHLRDQEDPVALTGNHLADKLLGATVSVISRRIEQSHAERNAGMYRLRFDRRRMSSLPEVPGTLTQSRDGSAVWKPYGTPRGLRCRACGGER